MFWLRGNSRSQRIARALETGAIKAGYRVNLRHDGQYEKPAEPIVAFYGFQKETPRIMAECLDAGRHVVFCDLGYWHRRQGGRFAGYHKIAINGRHPSEGQLSRPMPDARWRRVKVAVRPWREKGEHIVLAGMSAKSAESYGLKPEEWERWAVRELRKHTRRKIVYRPKPSWRGARAIPNAETQGGNIPLSHALMGSHAVVTHHSNVAIDGLVSGIPAFCWDGAAHGLALQDLSRIEEPWCPEGREQWLANLAWCQWTVQEMRSGDMWQHLKRQGLIP